jgi:iron(III) transport system ATP-binding protein
VQVSAPVLAPHALLVHMSLNFLSDRALVVGSRLPLRLMAERLRVF